MKIESIKKYDESEAIEYAGYMMDLMNLAEI